MRRSITALAVLVVTAVFAGFAPPASAESPVTYVEPVSGRVVDPFRPPSKPYGPGNRGLEYATVAGSSARASAPGRVTFAGNVAGARHVVIQHRDGVRTSYSFLHTVGVRVGQTVRQSEAVGTTGKRFHFGARIGDAYIDPAILLASGPARVHLVPDGEFKEQGAYNDRWAMFTITYLGQVIGRAAWEWASAGADAVGQAVRAIASGAVDLAQLAAGTASLAMRKLAAHLITILDEIVNLGQAAGPAASLAAALADILQAFLEPCTPPDQPPPAMPQPQNRIAVFVAGLGSSSNGPSDKKNLSYAFRARDELGYAPEHVYDFSYRGGRHPRPYKAGDTTDDLRRRAADLRELLDQIARHHPGKSVDLIAHSQGGLITREALAPRYDRGDRVLPPVARVVTLGTPHHGADLATMNAWLRWTANGRAVRQLAKATHPVGFDPTQPGVAQLSETSDFIRDLNRRALRDGVAYTSIGAAADSIAPAVRTRLAGASNVLVDSGNLLTSHSGLHHSEPARRELRLALADAPPTCQAIATTAQRAMTSAGIAEIEDAVGRAVVVSSATANS